MPVGAEDQTLVLTLTQQTLCRLSHLPNSLVHITAAFASGRQEAEPKFFFSRSPETSETQLLTLLTLLLCAMALPERDSPRGGSSAVTKHLQNSKKTLPCGWRVPQCSLSSVSESTGCQKTNAFFSSKLFLLQMLSISIWEAFNMSNSYCWSVGGLAKYQLSPRNSSPYCFRSRQDSSQAGRGKECAVRSKS